MQQTIANRDKELTDVRQQLAKANSSIAATTLRNREATLAEIRTELANRSQEISDLMVPVFEKPDDEEGDNTEAMGAWEVLR